ncbi:MAG: hypothetical protein K6G08_07715 [Prevotella sp.]|nr:hypothetical protein [Prevotella sp.]
MNKNQREITLEGVMTFSQLETGQHVADFSCLEDVRMEPFTGKCKVQMMRDGNMYVSEMPCKQRNKPLFREDNCSLSHTRTGKFYFVFTLDDSRYDELPALLQQQARSIVMKYFEQYICKQ